MKWKKIFHAKHTDKQQGQTKEQPPSTATAKKLIKKPCCSKCALVCKCKHHRLVRRTVLPRCSFESSGLLLN
uniref:Uncharacterized protein n=1 Tax=Anopheles albimanus TaxID=7167 RepID=A0A182FX12_ANOAL